jgi:anti-anti-sigma factor
MNLTYADLPDGVRKIDLAGRLDVEGANTIDLRLTSLTSTSKTLVVVDLSGVEFLASLGIATLVRCARATRQRQGHFVLFNARPNVAQVLVSTRMDHLLPMYADLEQARAALFAGLAAES